MSWWTDMMERRASGIHQAMDEFQRAFEKNDRREAWWHLGTVQNCLDILKYEISKNTEGVQEMNEEGLHQGMGSAERQDASLSVDRHEEGP